MSHTPAARRRRRIAAPVAGVALCLVPSACGDSGEAADSAPDVATVAESGDADTPAFGLVTVDEAADLAVDPDVTVIDVRTPEEYAEGHLDGASLIDFYSDSFADELADLDPDATYLVYCRSGNRSGQATAMMAELGIEQVYDLDGGVIAWSAQGGPLVR